SRAEDLVCGEGAEPDRSERGRQPAFQPGPAITFARPGPSRLRPLPCRRRPAELLRNVTLVIETLLAFFLLEPLELLEHDGEPTGSQPDDTAGHRDAGDHQGRVHASTARSNALRTAPGGATLPVQISK